MITTSDFEKGLWIELDGQPWRIMDVNRQTPSARGASLLVKVKLKNPQTGQFQDKTFRGGDKVGVPHVDERPVQYLYSDANHYHFMDQESYEQYAISPDDLGDATQYLTENMELKAVLYDGRVVGVDLPAHVELEITETPPPVKGGTSGNMTKNATLETGLVIQVPPYMTQGERVRVDTRDGRFVQRVS